MPFIMDCESGLEDWTVKADISGWRLGDSDSLNCYYLNFSSNAGHFLGIDSYTAGEGVHVSDIAISPPINMANYENITLSFDYMLITGIYGTTNDIQVLYRLNEASGWITLADITDVALDWKNFECPLPPEAAVSGFQLGFKYDDNYKWGMGAGLDNINLTGTLVITDDISLESISSPASPLCFESNPRDLTITVKNTGNTIISSGEVISINTQCNGIQNTKNYTLTQNIAVGSALSISYTDLIEALPVGSHDLIVNIWWAHDQNSSNNSKTKNIIILELPTITFTDPPEILCEDSEPVQILASPTGGSFESDKMAGNTFYPSTAGIGTHIVNYTFTDAYGCSNSSIISIEVVPLPEVSFSGLTTDYCLDDPAATLIGIPAGGIFDGPGITNNVFSPQTAGVGTHMINYTFTDAFGCTNTNHQQTNVNPLTQLSFTNLTDNYCGNADPVTLTAIPEGGIFYINDQVINVLDPSQYQPGTIVVRYLFENANGCNASISKNVNILALPEVMIADPGNPLCHIDLDINLVGQPTGGTFSGAVVGESTFNPLEAGIGDHDIFYTYEDANLCTNSDTLRIQVVDLPVVTFTGLSSEYCVNEENVILSGIPAGGIFDGLGITNNTFFLKLPELERM